MTDLQIRGLNHCEHNGTGMTTEVLIRPSLQKVADQKSTIYREFVA